MDKLRLGMKANDEIQPDLRELIDVMNRLSMIPSRFEGKQKIQTWYVIKLYIFQFNHQYSQKLNLKV